MKKKEGEQFPFWMNWFGFGLIWTMVSCGAWIFAGQVLVWLGHMRSTTYDGWMFVAAITALTIASGVLGGWITAAVMDHKNHPNQPNMFRRGFIRVMQFCKDHNPTNRKNRGHELVVSA